MKYMIVLLKKSMFIGYVNKLRSNFGKMQPSVLANLFKAHIVVLFIFAIVEILNVVDLIKLSNYGILPLD